MSNYDWNVAIKSEVFREYAEQELQKMHLKKASMNDENDTDEILSYIKKFEQMEMDIKNSPKQLKVFKAMQEKFASDPEYTKQVDKRFVDAVMLLNLEGNENDL